MVKKWLLIIRKKFPWVKLSLIVSWMSFNKYRFYKIWLKIIYLKWKQSDDMIWSRLKSPVFRPVLPVLIQNLLKNLFFLLDHLFMQNQILFHLVTKQKAGPDPGKILRKCGSEKVLLLFGSLIHTEPEQTRFWWVLMSPSLRSWWVLMGPSLRSSAVLAPVRLTCK